MLQALAIGAMIGGSLLSAGSSYTAGRLAKEQGNLEALSYEDQAREVLKMSKIDLYRQKRYAEQVRGSQVTEIAHSGGMLDDPTSQEILKDTAREAELDAWLIKYNASQEAANLRSAARSARAQGRQALTAGKIGAASSLLSGLSSAYFTKKKMEY